MGESAVCLTLPRGHLEIHPFCCLPTSIHHIIAFCMPKKSYCMCPYAISNCGTLKRYSCGTLIYYKDKPCSSTLCVLQAIEHNMKLVYVMGRTMTHPKPGSGMFRNLMLEHTYNFLRRNSRTASGAFNVPRDRLVEVGVVVEI